ncbi:MAG: hypothetical protein QXG63_03890, partial [Nitrososphaerales archaeon]
YPMTYYQRNRDKILKKKKEYRERKASSIKEYQARYYQANKEKKKKKVKERYLLKKAEINKKQVKYRAHLRSTDPFFKLRHNIRSLMSSVLRQRFFRKDSKTAELLGCTWEKFKQHIESQFDSTMNWDNYGTVWTYDHICPVSQARSKDELIKLQHYLNIRPCKDNFVKSDHKTPEGEQLCLQLLGRKWINKGAEHDKLEDQD